ncbi:MAG: ATP-dependent DNA helicase, partial [Kineosporiaceae bacterium]
MPVDVALNPLLDAAVQSVGGMPRAGQQQMAEAVAAAMDSGEHLLVQAGTGTGKSLAYLVPAIAHAVRRRQTVVISTATLALQAQVVERDLPRVADALEGLLGRRPTWQLVKGRANYLCRHKLGGGYPVDDGGLFELAGARVAVSAGRLGAQVVRLREWAEATTTGDRDEVVPGVSEQAWRQVSVGARECLGSQSCPSAAQCFCDGARERAREVDIVVTNHAIVAIDAFEGRSLLPEHEVLVVDEAHELADRVTSVVSRELTVTGVDVAARRARAAGVSSTALDDAGAQLAAAFEHAPEGRLTSLPEELGDGVVAVRDAARDLVSAL